MNNPCINCIERCPGCQSRCLRDDHVKYDLKTKAKREAIATGRHEQSDIEAYKKSVIERTKRMSHFTSK